MGMHNKGTYTHVLAYAYTCIDIRAYNTRMCSSDIYLSCTVCVFVMHSHKFLYVKHCWLNITFMGMKKASKRNLHIVETCMPMNESYHIWSFNHFANSPTNQCFFDTCLILSYKK